VQCATSDLLQDAAFNVETWLMDKVSQGFRNTINAAILAGDGVGKPLGILHPNSGIPICDVSVATQPGQFQWQDLVMLKFEIPMQWQDGCSFLMNQRTTALLLPRGPGIPVCPTGAGFQQSSAVGCSKRGYHPKNIRLRSPPLERLAEVRHWL
jgi:hypothetical protein